MSSNITYGKRPQTRSTGKEIIKNSEDVNIKPMLNNLSSISEINDNFIDNLNKLKEHYEMKPNKHLYDFIAIFESSLTLLNNNIN